MYKNITLVCKEKLSKVIRYVRGSSVLQRSGVALALRVVGVGLSFLVSIFFAKSLGVEQYGIYIYWVTIASVVFTLSSLGTPQVVTRELAVARGLNDIELSYRVILYGTYMTGFIFVLVFGTGVILATSSDSFWRSTFWVDVRLLAFTAIAVSAVSALCISILLGYERVLTSLWLGLVSPFFTVTGASVLWWTSSEVDAFVAMQIGLLASFLGACIAIFSLFKLLPRFDLMYFCRKLTRAEGLSWLTLGVGLAVNQFLTNAITQTDILMLGLLSSPESTAHYHAASRISYITAFFFGSIAGVVAPTISRLYAAGRYQELIKSTQEASLFAFLGTTVLALIIFIFGNHILSLFGSSFLEADTTMYVMIITWVLHAAFGLNHTVLIMTGHVKVGILSLFIAMLCNISLNFVFIPLWGSEGAAISSFISFMLCTLIMWIFVRRKFGRFLGVFDKLIVEYVMDLLKLKRQS